DATATSDLGQLLRSAISPDRWLLVQRYLALTNGAPPRTYESPLRLYRRGRMTADEFAKIADQVTTVATNNAYIDGRININTASAEVLSCLPGISDTPDLAQTLVTYRQSNPDKLGTIAWIVDALGQNGSSALDALQTNDCITVRSYQFTADIAALGP